MHVGKEGVTDAAARSLEGAFNNRELLKVKVLEACPTDTRETAHALAERVAHAHVVQTMGRVATLYRPHPEKPELKLPKK